MKRLVYTSLASETLGPDDIFKIIRVATSWNGDHGLTGFLLFEDGRFLQMLEGDADALDDIFSKVRSDPRHHSVELRYEASAVERCFPRWRMKRLLGDQAMLDAICDAQEAPLPRKVVFEVENFLGWSSSGLRSAAA